MATPIRSKQAPIAGAQVFDLNSEYVTGPLAVFVSFCGVMPGEVPEVVLYVTDGNANFGLATEIVRPIQRSGLLPPMLVVGIGYQNPLDGGWLRNRDLTPTVDSGRGLVDMPDKPVGQASCLANCIQYELKPWVDATFGKAPRVAYSGHSFGGLFGAWATLKTPELFDDYIISSPSTWWDDELPLTTEALVPDGLQIKVYVGVGSEETPEGANQLEKRVLQLRGKLPKEWEDERSEAEPVDMVDVALRYADRLKVREDIQVKVEVLDGEHHVTALGPVLSRGLRWLYGDL